MAVDVRVVVLGCICTAVVVVLFALAVVAAVKEPGARRAAISSLAGAGIAAASGVTNVIPLVWDASASVYMISFQVGADTVSAAFDTGSAQFVVATSQCGTCSGALYNPAASSTSLALYDPRGATNTTLCQTTLSYASQSDAITMFQDTVTFARRQLSAASALCTNSVSSVLRENTSAAPPLIITQFPVAGVVSNTGSSSLNVFGMSAVLSATTFNGMYLLPSCQTSRTPAYESAILQAVAQYETSRGSDVVWSMALGQHTGFVVFAPLSMPCMRKGYTPLLQSLPTANSALGRTPHRYYVVAVQSWTVTRAGQGPVNLIDAPQAMVIDTGTTQCMLPSARSAAQLANLRDADVSLLTFAAAPNALGAVPATVTFTSSSTTFSGGQVFAPMDAALSQDFSSDGSVGILGATAMRELYVEFNLTRSVMALAYF